MTHTTLQTPPPVDTGGEIPTFDSVPVMVVVVGIVIAIGIYYYIGKRYGRHDPTEYIYDMERFISRAQGLNLAGYFAFTSGTAVAYLMVIFYFTIVFRDVPVIAIIGMLAAGSTIGWARLQIQNWYRQRMRGVLVRGVLRTSEGRKDAVLLRNVIFREEYLFPVGERQRLRRLGINDDDMDRIHAYPTMIGDKDMALFVFVGAPIENALKYTEDYDIDMFGSVPRPTAHVDMLVSGTIVVNAPSDAPEGGVVSREVPVIRVLYDDHMAKLDIEGIDRPEVSAVSTELAKYRAEFNEGRLTAAAVASYRQALLEEHTRNSDIALKTEAIAMQKASERFANMQTLTRLQRITSAATTQTLTIILSILAGLAIGLFLGVAYANWYWAGIVNG